MRNTKIHLTHYMETINPRSPDTLRNKLWSFKIMNHQRGVSFKLEMNLTLEPGYPDYFNYTRISDSIVLVALTLLEKAPIKEAIGPLKILPKPLIVNYEKSRLYLP